MNSILNIVPAGAGSGKTFKIKTDLTEWVRSGESRPDRIMAVTFTEAAAGELRERVRSSLISEGMVDAALAVERAYVSTIHGLGLRILTEHAFAAGASPQPRHLSDAERDLLIRQELAQCSALEPLKADLPRFGYSGNSWNGGTTEDDFRSAVFRTIDLLRGLGDGGTDPTLAEGAVEALCALYGEVVDDAEPLRVKLQRAAANMLAEFADGGTPFGSNSSAKKEFREQLIALRAAAHGEALTSDWKTWSKLRDLRTKVQGAKIPEQFVTFSEDVMEAAEGILLHPGPLEDACTNLRSLITGAQKIMSGYAEKKRSAGVIDFADMIVDAERLLRKQPDILDAIVADIDCVIVDEFQDTNPVQFALLWRIAQAAPRTLLVGDTKQSIMGFQGADARLTNALVEQYPKHVFPLDKNWRSDPRIMRFVNEISARLFGENYVALTPQRPETGQTFLEFVRVSEGRRSRKSRPEQHIAARIKAILDEPETIIDRHSDLTTPVARPVRPGDIAILCQTHSQAARYADSLQSLSVPVRINREGWLSSPPIIAACNALAFVADPSNTHAAMCLLTLGPRALPLQDAMTALADNVLLDMPELASLVALAQTASTTPLATLVPQVIATAGLRDWANQLPNATQMRADLLRLEAEVATFENAHRDLKAAAGFYGHTAPVFLGWLRAQSDERDFDRHPDPSSGSVEGVEIVTWHASKGREWNIVFVVGLDNKIGEKPGTMRAEFTEFADLDDVLSKTLLSFTPSLLLKEKQDLFIHARREAAEQDARRLLYVALTRARDRLVLEWPDFALGKPTGGLGPGHYAEMLALDCGVDVQPGKVAIGENSFPTRIVNCPNETPAEFETTVDVKIPKVLGFGELRSLPEIEKTPWRVRPSQIEAHELDATTPIETLDLDVPVSPTGDGFDQANVRGTAWHLAFRTAIARPDLLDRVCTAAGLEKPVITAISEQAEAVTAWLKSHGYNLFHLELPLQIHAETGAQTNAIIDLLAEGEDGFMIIDHKSGGTQDLAKGFAIYKPQLEAYQAVLAQQFPDKPVRGFAINWMQHGVITLEWA